MLRTLRLVIPALLLLPLALLAQDEPPPIDLAEIDELVEKIEKGEQDERRSAIDTLFGRKDERITGIVLELLTEKKQKEEIVQDILRGIGLAKVEAGYEPAIEMLKHKKPGVRSFAAVCLERLEKEEAKKDLLKALGKQRDKLALKNMMRAVGVVASNQADVGKALIKRFSHKESIVAANAVLSCRTFTEEGRVRSMVANKIGALLCKTSDVRVRSACIYGLGLVGTKKELPELEKLKKSLRGSMNPLAMGAIEAARTAEEMIRSGSTDEVSGGVFARLFDLASDDDRDPARDGDPEKPVPAWLSGDWRGGGRGGRGGR